MKIEHYIFLLVIGVIGLIAILVYEKITGKKLK